MSECVLCKEHRRNRVVHENKYAYTIMSINPVKAGHILILPKKCVPNLEDLTDEEKLYLIDEIEFMRKILKKKYGTRGVTLFCGMENGTQPQHLHFQMYPEEIAMTHMVMGEYYGVDATKHIPQEELQRITDEMKTFIDGVRNEK
ncbi:MAG: HIT family protein [Candidatus Diapherotrites archaeon]|nr:HIT family protein [Candidatus Diapherotrites archaeon]